MYAARKVPRIKVVWDAWFLTCVAQWERIPETPWLIHPSLPPPSPIAPPLSDEEDDPSLSQTASVVGDNLDIGNVDWGDAWGEIDDFLNETDDEETDGEVTDSSTGGGAKKRRRPQTDSEDEGTAKGTTSNGVPPAAPNPPAATKVVSTLLAGSPLQKRVKTSRSRKSRLKVSYPAADVEEDERADVEEDSSQLVEPAPPAPRAPAEVPPPGDGYEASQGSSSLDSDDDAFFASMAAEVESGWS